MKLSPYYCALAAIVLPALTLAKTACYFKNVLCVTVAESGNFVNVTIESTASGWSAVGINSEQSMGGADVWLIWPNADGTVTISDRHNVGESDCLPDTRQDLVALPGSSATNGKTIARFSRAKSTTDTQHDMAVLSDAQYWIFATSSVNPGSKDPRAPIAVHNRRFAPDAQSLLGEGGGATNEADDGEPPVEYALAAVVHGSLMFTAWAVLIPAAIFVAMFEKASLGVWWFRLHVALSVGALLCVVASLAIMFYATGVEMDELHAQLGLSVVVIAIGLQMPLGVIIDRLWNPYRQSTPWHDRVHWWLGRGLFVLAAVTIYTGLEELEVGSTWIMAYFAYVFGFLLALVFGVVGGLRWRKNRKKDPHAQGIASEVNASTDLLRQPQQQGAMTASQL